jgi:type IV pilus assembly protein PilM
MKLANLKLANLKEVFSENYIIGLDIGSASVKMAQFIRKDKGLQLIRVGLQEIKKHRDNALREQEILSLIKSLLTGIDIKRSKVIVNINCPKTAIKKVQTPVMPKSELQKAIMLEAKTYFPFPVSDAFLDFEILGEITEGGIRKYEVLIAAAPKETINKHLSLLGKAGIKPATLVPSAYAFQKLAERSLISAQAEKGKTTCFVDIDELYTELVIFKDKHPVFNRKMPIAGKDFTKALTDILASDSGTIELSLDEAEEIKRKIGLPREDEPKLINGRISTVHILSMLRAPLEQLTSEIERCFDYYIEETRSGKIDSLVLFGGGAALIGLDKFLSERLGIAVRVGNPLEGLKAREYAVHGAEGNLHRLETAIGAALTEGRGVNLLPPEIKEETKRAVMRGTLEVVATVIVIVSILVYASMNMQLGNFERRISTAKLEFSSLQPQFTKAEGHHAANMVLLDEPHWRDVFMELSRLIPGDIYLTRLKMSDDSINMRGIVSSKDGEHILSNFMLILERGLFDNVRLIETRDLADGAGNEFEMECWVDEDR